MYVLYGGDYTRSTLVQWVLEAAGLAFEFRRIDILKDEHRTPAFLAINPAGQVPVLVTPEGQVLTETAALMLHLADRHALAELAPAPADPERGPFLSAMLQVACDIQPEMKRYHYPHRYALRPEDSPAVQRLARQTVMNRLAVMEGRLSGAGPFLLGSRFSMADALLAYWIAWLRGAAALTDLPAVGRLYAQVCDRPGISAVLGETEAMAERYDAMVTAQPGGVIA